MKKESIIKLKDISVFFGSTVIMENLNLDIKKGDFVTLLGPSGCGKTTILRIIAGFLKPDKGSLYFEGKEINKWPPHKRKINTIFQNYSLFPHLNVFDNIAFGLKIAKKDQMYIAAEVKKMLKMVNLQGFEDRDISELSGGQQQRVAIARALINRPKVLLLDEPLAALDLKLRKDMQAELKSIQKQTGITFIFVTHDQEEALSMSDIVVVMDSGKIQQIGTPTDIYNEPKNAFVADFIGESNIVDGVMKEDYKVQFAAKLFKCLDSGFEKNERVDVVIRPEDVEVTSPSSGDISGEVTSVTFLGVHYEIIVDIKGFKWMIQSTEYQKVGDKIGLILEPNDIHIMKKSEHSGQYGDYSSFSEEFEQLNTIAEE